MVETTNSRGSVEPAWRSVFERHEVVARDGTVLAVYRTPEASSSKAPQAVLVNAYGMPVDIWVPLAERLREHYALTTWESRGVPNLEPGFDVERCGVAHHATDLADIAQQLGLGQFLLIGWCSGAQVALRFAAEHAAEVAQIVLLTGGFRLPDAVPVSDFQRQTRAFLPPCAESPQRAQIYRDVMFGRGEAAQADLPNGHRAAIGMVSTGIPKAVARMTAKAYSSGEALYRYANMLLRFWDEPDHAWAKDISAEVLVVAGGNDAVVGERPSREIAARLPRSRLLLRPEGDHFLHYSQPDVADEILRFTGVGASSSAGLT